jgi:hypothetical protein
MLQTSNRSFLRIDASRLVSSVRTLTGPPLAADDAGLPAGTTKAGTLTGPQLMRDTMQGVAGKVAALGCDKIDNASRYVVTPFSGAPDSTVAGEVACQGFAASRLQGN